MGFVDDLKARYARQSSLGQLIVIIVGITLAGWLLGYLYQPAYNWLKLPSGLLEAVLQPWAVLSYGFLHTDIFHLFWNMFILFGFGQFMLNLFSSRQLITLFFAGILSGAVFFLLGAFLFPSYVGNAYLVGASAGVYAVAIFVCAYQPESEVRLIFFNVKLKYIGYVLLVISLAGVLGRVNVGGNLAHLGGLAIGYYAAIKMKYGIDILKGFASIGDSFVNLFKASPNRPKKTKKARMKTVHRKAKGSKSSPKNSNAKQEKIDAILDKISDSGYESLSKAEKDFLFKAGKD